MKVKHRVCGLRQSPNNWFGTMAKLRFRPLKSDPYINKFEDGTAFASIALYVHHVLRLGGNEQVLNKLKKHFLGHFKMRDMADVSRALGMKVTCDREKGTSTVDQKYYTEDVFERFGVKACNPAFTPGAGPEV